jgi:hypothetical protein
VDKVKELYANGRRASLTEEEFVELLRVQGILPPKDD